jgi:hypothetical protein
MDTYASLAVGALLASDAGECVDGPHIESLASKLLQFSELFCDGRWK